VSDPFQHVSEATVARYSGRYRELGRHIRTLGWGSEAQQRYRFDRVMDSVALSGKRLLDIGCGFGDLLHYARSVGTAPASYLGWDINPDLIREANTLNNDPAASFEVVNLLEAPKSPPVAQTGVMLGLLNFNLKGKPDNLEYSKAMIRQAFEKVSETLVVDFLSTYLTPEYPPEESVYYHDPAIMLSFALELTPEVVLKHDYAPIPQKEFMLILKKRTDASF